MFDIVAFNGKFSALPYNLLLHLHHVVCKGWKISQRVHLLAICRHRACLVLTNTAECFYPYAARKTLTASADASAERDKPAGDRLELE